MQPADPRGRRLRRLAEELELAWPLGGLLFTALGGLAVYAVAAPFLDAENGERLQLAGQLVLGGSVVAAAGCLEWAFRLWQRSNARERERVNRWRGL